jgi:hypothetical protein
MKQAKNANSPQANNRKRTKGRIIQTVPIFDKPKTEPNRKVIDFRQIKHRNKIK